MHKGKRVTKPKQKLNKQINSLKSKILQSDTQEHFVFRRILSKINQIFD